MTGRRDIRVQAGGGKSSLAVFLAKRACMATENNKNEPIDTRAEIDAFVGSLDEPHRMLVLLKSQLYGGRWDPMLEDLQNRLEGKPYIFKLANRIKDDVERINRMRDFEQKHRIDLVDYVKLES
jgi:6-phosphogluconate dehydrogenase